MQNVTVMQYAVVPFSLTVDLAERFFLRPLQLKAGPVKWLRATVTQEASQIRDVGDSAMAHEALLVAWQPGWRFPLPDLHALLSVRVNAPTTDITLRCDYQPPFGFAGEIFDALIGHRIAVSTMRNLLAEICDFIEREYAVLRAQYPRIEENPISNITLPRRPVGLA
jgi:hypothetical protein